MLLAPHTLPLETDADPHWLDAPAEWSFFSQPVAGQPGCWDSTVAFEGMHCAACAFALEDAIAGVPGVVSVTVSAASRRGRVRWTEGTTAPSRWMRAVVGAGYRVVPMQDVESGDGQQRQRRLALWRWLVAGLCMMQVMMYATPAYLARPGDLTLEMEQLLRWASWVLSIPVMVFSCSPFFAAAWGDVRNRRISMDLPVALGVFVTFAASTAGTFDPQGLFGREVYFDSLTMFVFFLLTGRWLEWRLRERTAGALEVLINRLPARIERERPSGIFERVAVRHLVVGDVIRVLPGEAFPADGHILEGATHVDEALLTGESRPLARGVGEAVVAGSYNRQAPVRVAVTQLGRSTRFASIVALMTDAALSKPRIAQLADRLSRPFLQGVLLSALLALLVWWPTDPARAVMVAVAVLVATCPCALSLATPAAMLAAAGALARRGVLIRRLSALEALAGVDTVVFDKTGTLTRDAFVLAGVTCRPHIDPGQTLQWAVALARHSLHPVSRALVECEQALSAESGVWAQAPVLNVSAVSERPGLGLSGCVEVRVAGISGARQLRLGAPHWCGLSDEADLRGHVVACLADEDGWLATFVFQEDVRPDAQAAVMALRSMGLGVHLLSGDRVPAVAHVASQLGIADYSGACTPEGKLQWLRAAQVLGRHVLMVGDGLNDAPAIAAAQVSVAFGQAVPLTQAQADGVVLSGRVSDIALSIQVARKTMRIVRQNLGWAAMYNAVCVPLALLGALPAWLAGLGMALSSLLVVLNASRATRFEPPMLSKP
jgi:P-type Cu2+ transporter